MVAENDYRVDNVRRLEGQKFRFKIYKGPRPDWDHDHCAACWQKFAEFEGPDILHEGFAVTDEYDKGADYVWICSPCFKALKDRMRWSVVP
jgi:hypothetical protein